MSKNGAERIEVRVWNASFELIDLNKCSKERAKKHLMALKEELDYFNFYLLQYIILTQHSTILVIYL